MTGETNADMKEVKKRSQNRFSMLLKRTLFGGDEEEAVPEGNRRIFEVKPVPEANVADEKFHSVGTEALDYTSLEVKHFSANSAGSEASPAPREYSAFDLTIMSLDPPKRRLRPRPKSMIQPQSELKRSSAGLGDFPSHRAKRSSLEESSIKLPVLGNKAF